MRLLLGSVIVLTMETFVNMWWLRFWQFVTVEAKPVVFCLLRRQIHSWGC